MIFRNRWRVILSLTILFGFGLACWQPASAGPTQGWIINLGTLEGHNYSNPRGINELGLVVGVSSFINEAGSTTSRRAFLRLGGFNTDGTMIDLGTLGGAQSEAVAINDRGEIGGWSMIPGSSVVHAFLIVPEYDTAGDPITWFRDENNDGANDLMQDLGIVSDGPQTIALGINEAGNVVGGNARAFPGTNGEAFLNFGGLGADSPDNYIMLGTLGGDFAYAYGINESQWIVGGAQTYDFEREHAFLIIPDTDDNGIPISWGAVQADGFNPLMIDLNNYGWGGSYSHADDINNAGYVVGRAETSADLDGDGELDLNAFLYKHGLMTSLLNLGTLGGHYSYARAINGAGDVVGAAAAAADLENNHAFLLTPVDSDENDEPDQWVSDSDGDGANDLMYDLNNLRDGLTSMDGTDWGTLVSATAINDAGYLVGRGQIADGYERAFIFMPAGDDSQGVEEEQATINVKSAIVNFDKRRPDKGMISVKSEFDAGELVPDNGLVVSMTFNGIELFNESLGNFRKCRNNYVFVKWGYYVRLNFVKKIATVIRWKVDLNGLSPKPDTVVDVTLNFDNVKGTQQITMQPDKRGKKLVYVRKKINCKAH